MNLALHAAFTTTPYELLDKIGEGGFGEVWRARRRPREDDPNPPTNLAIKILKDDNARLGPRLEHDNIIAVYDQGSALGRPYQVLELFEGQDLRAILDARGPLPLLDIQRILLPLIDAVEFAHHRGIIHRDIKPENILVSQSRGRWRVKLTDFGLARELRDELVRSATFASAEGVSGTLAYIAPEALQNPSAPSPSADIYAIGVVLFETLTGRLPQGFELPSELRPELDPRFDDLIKSTLASRPHARPHSASQLRRALLDALRSTNPDEAPVIIINPETSPTPHTSTPSSHRQGMTLIPASTFVQGTPDDPFASPQRLVTLDPFWLDEHPVTNAQYLTFIQATNHPPPQSWASRATTWSQRKTFRFARAEAHLPVTGVTFADAQAYAAWANKRLPTEAEWERAAQGPRGWLFPYGDTLDLTRIHHDLARLAPVDAHPQGASPEGILDLTGNAWEWCNDRFDRRAYAGERDVSNPTGPTTGDARVIRGGYDPQQPGSGSATFRSSLRQDLSHKRIGFRCAASPTPDETHPQTNDDDPLPSLH